MANNTLAPVVNVESPPASPGPYGDVVAAAAAAAPSAAGATAVSSSRGTEAVKVEPGTEVVDVEGGIGAKRLQRRVSQRRMPPTACYRAHAAKPVLKRHSTSHASLPQ
jgi:hypothetical protein